MRYRVTGYYRISGKAGDLVIDAADEMRARKEARGQGLLVSEVVPASGTAGNTGRRERDNDLGIASLVTGGVAFGVMPVPIAIPNAINLRLLLMIGSLGLLLGIAGLIVTLARRGHALGTSIGGIALCTIAIEVAWAWWASAVLS